tara:strand:+ start:5855 stop:7846 length:1992 start_codon:yes stop_codon:yes gene_type:complete
MAKKRGQERITNIPIVYQERIGMLSEHPAHLEMTDQNSFEKGEPVITNPDLIEIAQKIRASEVIMSPPSLKGLKNKSPHAYYARRLYKTSDKVDLKGKLLIRERDVSGKSINVKLKVFNIDNFNTETKNFKINHGTSTEIFHAKTKPPVVSAEYIDGQLKIRYRQIDKFAHKIGIYLKEVTGKKSAKYVKITTLAASHLDQDDMVYEVPINLSRPAIVRAISIKNKTVTEAFVDSVVYPDFSYSGDSHATISLSDQIPNFATISAFSSADGITIMIDNIQTHAVSMKVVRRNITLGERKFTAIRTPIINLLRSNETSYQFKDRDVQDGEFFEYRCDFTMPSGICVISQFSAIQNFIRPQNDVNFAITNVSQLPPAADTLEYAVGFSLVPVTSSNQVQSVRDILSVVAPGLYSSNFSDMKNFLNYFVAFTCKRINTASGNVEDLGVYPPGTFLDQGNRRLGIKPPVAGVKYYYVVEMVLRDIEQMIEETKNLASEQAKRKGGESPIPEAKRSEDTKEISTQSKHLSPTALSQGVIAYGASLLNYSPGSSIDGVPSGIQKIVTITSDLPVSSIFNASVDVVGGYPIISWSIKGSAQTIDHFVIRCTQSGYSHPCGSAHHISTAGTTYKFIDTTQTIPGVVSYSVTPVYTSYTTGRSVQAGNVLIK